jgi:hypothetical protein
VPTPTYRDVVSPSLIDVSMPSNGRAEAAQSLANTFRNFSNAGLDIVGQQRAEQGRREGAEAGRTDHPGFRTGMKALTAYGQAYNDTATRSYAIKSEIDADESATRLENEAGNDPEHFRLTFGARRDETIKNAPPEARAILAEVYDRRMASGMQRLIGVQAVEMKNAARNDVAEGVTRMTDTLGQLRASNDPNDFARAEEEQIKLDMLIDAATNDGTLSVIEASALRLDSTRKTVAQTVTYRFRDELDNPYGDPIGFIENLRERNKTSNSLPPDEEAKLMDGLLGELRERNSLANAKRQMNDGAQAARWAAGEKTATSMLLSGSLRIGTIQRMVDEDELDPALGRSLREDLLQGNDRPDDSKERFRVETNLLKISEDEITKNGSLSWDTRRELITKRREQINGWRGTQQAREAADRIDRALGILPGTRPESMSEEELEQRDRALTEWYSAIDELPADQQRANTIPAAEEVIQRVIKSTAASEATQLRNLIEQVQKKISDGELDRLELKDAEKTLSNLQNRLREAEAKAK